MKLWVFIVLSLLTACSAIQLETMQANRVIVSQDAPPKSCKFRGQILGNQGNCFTGSWTSNKNLELGAMNDLRNKAGRLGANYVQLLTTRQGNTGSMMDGHGHFEQTNITNLGNAYACDADEIGLTP